MKELLKKTMKIRGRALLLCAGLATTLALAAMRQLGVLPDSVPAPGSPRSAQRAREADDNPGSVA